MNIKKYIKKKRLIAYHRDQVIFWNRLRDHWIICDFVTTSFSKRLQLLVFNNLKAIRKLKEL